MRVGQRNTLMQGQGDCKTELSQSNLQCQRMNNIIIAVSVDITLEAKSVSKGINAHSCTATKPKPTITLGPKGEGTLENGPATVVCVPRNWCLRCTISLSLTSDASA
mmetsp:Transcript_1173/g.2236  ORF Transcript_1173/g.2236 Transcript_1173/m.2236 type:complete len:107 (-) Transcript_1173:432-752(-)